MIIERQSPLLEFDPVQVLGRHPVFFHGNAIVYRANQFAQITAYAFLLFYGVGIVGLAILQVDGLVRSVFTGDITQAAMNAFVLVDFCDVVVVDVEVFPMGDLLHGFTDEVVQCVESFFIHPVA